MLTTWSSDGVRISVHTNRTMHSHSTYAHKHTQCLQGGELEPLEAGEDAVDDELASRSAPSNLIAKSGLSSLNAAKNFKYTSELLHSKASRNLAALSAGIDR